MSPRPEDLIWWVVFAALVGGAIGFFTCAIFASKTISRVQKSHYWEGYGACNRDHQNRLVK
jgi:hypothetical protein